METLFALALLVTIEGQSDAFVLDHGLTHEDCMTELRHTGESGHLTAQVGSATIHLTCQPQ